MTPDLPAVPSLEFLRKQAKAVLRDARAGGNAALERLRAVPRLEGAPTPAAVCLADAQHAVALEHGFESWTKLKSHVEEHEPIEAQAARFLAAIRDGRANAARRLLTHHPAIARANVWAASAAGNAAFVADAVARDPRLATAALPPSPRTPLLDACASPLHAGDPEISAGILECVRILLAAGADANSYILFADDDPDSRLPALYFACVHGNAAVARLLLERGANPNDGESTYHSAELGRFEILELLLAHGADLSGQHPRWRNTPLYFLAGYREVDPTSASALRGVRWLLDNGADPNVPCGDGDEVPLHMIARHGGLPEMARVLLEHGARVGAKRADGRTPYVLAVRTGHTDVAAVLLEHGAEPGGVMPADELLGACMRGDEPAARALLAKHPGILKELSEADLNLIAQAAGEGNIEAVRVMVALGFELTREGEWAGTPLHHAAWRGNVALVRTLLDLGAPVNVRDRQYGSSPLAWAAHGSTNCRQADDDYVAIVSALLDAGSDRATSINRWNEPPEDMASRRVTALLIERGFAPADNP